MKPPDLTLLEHLRRMTGPPAADAVLLDRWVHQRDEQAFAALVARHGPMVLGVCRRILGDAHEAEDAFQATFLILARKAASLKRPEALACWLHGVAARLAHKSRAAARRRAGHSRTLAAEPADSQPDPLELLTVREMLGLIDKEIGVLREVYRLPLVLCDLEGRTQEEAAGLLGWTLGSLRGRLLRGRAQLKARLERRGLTLPAGIALPLVGAVLSESLPAAGPVVAPQLAASVTQAAVRFSMDSVAAELSGSAVDLAKEGLRILILAKVKTATAMVLTLAVFVAGAGLLGRRLWQEKPAEERHEDKASAAANAAPNPTAEKPQVRLDRFGDPLPEGAVARLGTVRFRHGYNASSVAFAPDGKTLASGGWDNTVRLWEIATGKELHRFTAAKGLGSENAWVSSIAISPDGKFLAAGITNGPGEVVIWELAINKETRRLSVVLWPMVTSLAYSPDGKTLAAGILGLNASICLWDAQTGKLLRRLQGHKEWITSLAFAPDGKTLASASRDKTIRLWDTAAGRQLRQLQGHASPVLAVAFAPDGKTLASAGGDNTVRLWDAATGKELCAFNGHGEAVSALVFFPNGKTLASGSWDHSIRLWDSATSKAVGRLSGHQGTISSLAAAPDGKTLASASWDRTIRVWDVVKGKERRVTAGNQHGLGIIAISPDGKRGATGGEDGVVRLWDASSGKELGHLIEPGLLDRVGGGSLQMSRILGDHLRFTADGATVEGSSGSVLGRWNANTGKQISERHYEGWLGLLPTPDGKFVLGHNGAGEIGLMDAATGKKLRQFQTSQRVSSAVISPDSKFLACGTAKEDGTVVIWELATGEERCRCKGAPQLVYALAFSPDGKFLAGTTVNFRFPTTKPSIYLWDAATGREIRQFRVGGCNSVTCLAYSSDGRMLASGCGDKTVRLWEVVTGKERRRFDGHQGNVFSLAFSADVTRLVSASDDTTALVWDATVPTLAGKPTDKQLQAAWNDLAGDDAAKAYRAIWLLVRHPAQSVPLLREHVLPARPFDAEMRKRVDRWLTDLDSDKAEVREHASAELEKRVVMAEPILRKALTAHPSLEQRKRIERVLERLEREKVTLGRALEALEHAHAPESRRLLETLAAGEAEAWLTREAKAALQRP